MPLKQQYGRPPVPLRRALLRTPTTIMEEVRANSKSDAAFVKKMMEKNLREHPGRFEKPESDAMRERLEESGVYLSIPPPKTPRGKKFRNNHTHSIVKKKRIRDVRLNRTYEPKLTRSVF